MLGEVDMVDSRSNMEKPWFFPRVCLVKAWELGILFGLQHQDHMDGAGQGWVSWFNGPRKWKYLCHASLMPFTVLFNQQASNKKLASLVVTSCGARNNLCERPMAPVHKIDLDSGV